MSKTYMCELLRKVPVDEFDIFRDILIDNEVIDESYFNKPLEAVVEFLESKLDENADQDRHTVYLMKDAVARFKAMEYILNALTELEKDTGLCPDLGDELGGVVWGPAIDSVMTVTNLSM